MSLRLVLGAALTALMLSACATPKAIAPQGPVPPRRPAPEGRLPVIPKIEHRRVLDLWELRGWGRENHAEAFRAYRETCQVTRQRELADVCARAKARGPLGRSDARAFLEEAFQAEALPGEGVLTAYFAPVYAARHKPDAEFSMAVRPRPADLVNGQVYADRVEIEARPTDDALAWMRPEELFFLQIQGSGVLVFEDGRRMKALYAANNGRPFVGIANPMRDRGLLPRDNTSGEMIRAWLAENRGPRADEIMRLNPRYAFFRLAPDDGKPPVGAANVPLSAGRAIAVDPRFNTYGELFWIDGEAPLLAGAFPTYRRLVTALDTGGAIKGQVRADLYLGEGAAAGTEAGRVRHTLRMYRLVPRS